MGLISHKKQSRGYFPWMVYFLDPFNSLSWKEVLTKLDCFFIKFKFFSIEIAFCLAFLIIALVEKLLL